MKPEETSRGITMNKMLIEAYLLKGDISSAANHYERLAELYCLSGDSERSKKSYGDAMQLYADIHKYRNALDIARIIDDPRIEIYAQLWVITSQDD